MYRDPAMMVIIIHLTCLDKHKIDRTINKFSSLMTSCHMQDLYCCYGEFMFGDIASVLVERFPFNSEGPFWGGSTFNMSESTEMRCGL